jgi:hypothetical protein
MKTIQKDNDIKRVKDEEAEGFVSKGWAYVPKSVWRETKAAKKTSKKGKKSKK